MGIPIDPENLPSLMAALKGRSDTEWDEPRPMPSGARREYARFTRELAAYNEATALYKLADARLDVAKAELVQALKAVDPEAKRRNVQWDARDGTYQLEKVATVTPPSWVAEKLAEIEAEEAAERASGNAP
jgi:hypothetical protein